MDATAVTEVTIKSAQKVMTI